MTITVSTDGSALGNPNGPMGWAWADHAANAARTTGHQHDGDSDAGGATNGTNQIGELCAVLEALRAHRGSEALTIETDSQYAINCSTKWVKGWKRNGWKNSQKKPVKNAPLIKAIDAEIAGREGPVTFVWVKGHNGNPGNEKVDDLAHTYSGDARSGVKDGYLPLEGWQSLLASAYAKGVDIPSDARLLIDGKITEEQYHLGRGAHSGGDDLDDADNGGDSNSSDDQGVQDVQNDQGHGDEAENGSHSHKPTLAERLAGPEGVPDYDFGGRKPVVAHHRAADDGGSANEASTNDLDDANDSHESNGLNESETLDDSGFADTSTSTEPSEAAESSNDSEEPDAPNGPSTTNASDDSVSSASPEPSQPTMNGDSPSNPDHVEASSDSAVSDDANTAAVGDDTTDSVTDDEPGTSDKSDISESDSAAPKPQTPHQPKYLRSGLSVDGTLRFSPAPRTSPTFDGRPRRIRGVIAIDGYVAGDGQITLDAAPFLIANTARRGRQESR